MKKIKAINGYVIYEATKRDENRYNVTEGCFYLYFANDIKDYGISNSDYDWESDSLEGAVDFATSSNSAKANAIVEENYTCIDYESVNEVNRLLDLGINEEIIIAFIAGEESEISLHITTDHNGKMKGMHSLSSSCTVNENCKAYAKVKGSICEKCYAMTMAERFSKLAELTIKNAELLTSHLLTNDEIPIIANLDFRFEAFGDLINEVQFINYLRIVELNPRVSFAIWTKNPHIMDRVFKAGFEKPSNLKILVSSLMTNKVRIVEKYRYFVDHVFTVYTLKYLLENNLDYNFINCGARNCKKCLNCYRHTDADFYINELLKSDVARAKKIGFIK